MRKVLFGIGTALVIALTVYVIVMGLPFLKVSGYQDINTINRNLDNQIALIRNIKEVEYVSKERELNTETAKLKETREEYLAKVEAARVKGAKGSKVQLEVYELDFIWARVGNYATELDLELKLDVFPGTEEKTLNDFKLYNLKFTVNGAYTDMVRFIYKIEGDNEIAAQLSDFSMKPASVVTTNTEGEDRPATVTLSSEFTLKNVPLNYKNIIEDATKSTNTDDLNLPPANQPGRPTEPKEDVETETRRPEEPGIEEEYGDMMPR